MIKDRLQNVFKSNPSFRTGPPTTTPALAQLGASPSAVQFSPEAGQAADDGGRIGSLLGGLNSWGGPEQTRSNQSAAPQSAAGGWEQVLKSGQMPMGIINQVFNTMKTAGGMATAGALHSLLSWGSTEKQKTGQIRPEFQEILHQAIEIAKKNKNMSEEDLKKYEDRLFGDDKAKTNSGKSGKQAGKKHGSSVVDQIRKKLAAHGQKKLA